MATDLADLLDPAYLGDLPRRSIDDVRAMRSECQEVETGLSLLRRLVQGRLDIVGVELARRAEGGDPGDLADLIARLPEVLSDRTPPPASVGFRRSWRPARSPPELEAELDAIVGPGHLADLPSVDDDRPPVDGRGAGGLRGEGVGHRRDLFERIDALQAEITRRYKTGEASVDSLLQ